MRAVATVVPLLLVAACSGSDSPTRKDFVARSETVCAEANKQFDALPAPSDTAGVLTYVERLVQVAADATTRLDALEVPKKDAHAVEAKMMTPLRSEVAAGRTFVAKIRTAVQKRDQAALATLIAHPPTPTRADLGWMRGYGFRQCVTMADTGDR